MNEAKKNTLPDPDLLKNLKIHRDEVNVLVNSIEEKFNKKYAVIEPDNETEVNLETNVKFKLAVTHTLNNLVRCIQKHNDCIANLYSTADIKNYIDDKILPLKLKIENCEKSIQTKKNSDDDIEQTVIDMRDEMEEISENLNTLHETVTNEVKVNKEICSKIEEILNTSKSNIASIKKSIASGEVSFIQPNKNLKIPIFTNESFDKPLKYLNELKEYKNANINTDLKCILNNSLKKSASDWWHVVQSDVNNFEEFEEKFKESFWSLTIQEEQNKKLEFGRYRPDNKQTCVQYATHMAAIAKDLNYSEKDLVNKISRHFTKEVKNLIKSTANKTFATLIETLQELDNENKIRNRQNANNQNQEQKKEDNNNKKPNNVQNNKNFGNNNFRNRNNDVDKKPEFKRNQNQNNISVIADIHEDPDLIEEINNEKSEN